MILRTKHYWVPVRAVGVGYIRVEAVSEQEAIEMIEVGQFNLEEMIDMGLEGIEITGMPTVQEYSS